MNKTLLAVLALIAFAVTGYAITVNPASNVTADSANTALTIPYRDSNGVVNLDFLNAAQSGPVSTFSRTIAQLQVLVPAEAGDIYFCSNCANLLGNTGELVVSTGTSAGNFASAGGDQFK